MQVATPWNEYLDPAVIALLNAEPTSHVAQECSKHMTVAEEYLATFDAEARARMAPRACRVVADQCNTLLFG